MSTEPEKIARKGGRSSSRGFTTTSFSSGRRWDKERNLPEDRGDGSSLRRKRGGLNWTAVRAVRRDRGGGGEKKRSWEGTGRTGVVVSKAPILRHLATKQ